MQGVCGKLYKPKPEDWGNIVIIAVLSILFIIYILGKLAQEIRFYKNQQDFNQNENAKQLFLYLIIAPIGIVTLLNLPVSTWICLLPTIFMPMAYFNAMGRYKSLNLKDAECKVDKLSIPLLLLTILIIVIFRLLV